MTLPETRHVVESTTQGTMRAPAPAKVPTPPPLPRFEMTASRFSIMDTTTGEPLATIWQEDPRRHAGAEWGVLVWIPLPAVIDAAPGGRVQIEARFHDRDAATAAVHTLLEQTTELAAALRQFIDAGAGVMQLTVKP